MKAAALNLALATVWLLLSTSRSTADFFIGLGVGFALLTAFSAVLDTGGYPRRVLAVARFGARFLAEFLTANAGVALRVLFGRNDTLQPGFLTYDATGLTRGEILVLGYCITLTPGSTLVDISDDFRTLTIHVLDAHDPAAVRSAIDRRLRAPLLEATR